ncbi:MAG: histone H1-like repetitive region-containing protein [Thermoflexales bacterium]
MRLGRSHGSITGQTLDTIALRTTTKRSNAHRADDDAQRKTIFSGGISMPAAKKPVAKKPVAKKPAAKKAAPKKPAPKKPVAKRAAVKKPAVKKPAAKKPVAKKAAPRKRVVAAPAPLTMPPPIGMPGAPAEPVG